MVVECWAILAILLMMVYLFISRGKASVAGAILPLLLLPAIHLIGGPLSRLGGNYLPAIPTALIHVGLDVLAVVISCSIIGGLSRSIARRSTRNGYVLLCCGFTVILAWVLIFNTVHPRVF